MTADQLGRYGHQALNHIKQHRQKLYKELMDTGQLMGYLHQVEDDVWEMIYQIESKLLKKDPILDPMDTYESYRHKMMIRSQAEAIALNDLIYSVYDQDSQKKSDLKTLAAMREAIIKNKEKYKNGQWDQMDDDLSILAVKMAMEKRQ